MITRAAVILGNKVLLNLKQRDYCTILNEAANNINPTKLLKTGDQHCQKDTQILILQNSFKSEKNEYKTTYKHYLQNLLTKNEFQKNIFSRIKFNYKSILHTLMIKYITVYYKSVQ